MRSNSRPKGKKVHTRNIEISTYEDDENHIVVEGELKEDYLIPYYVSGEKREPHTVHHMLLRLKIELASLTVKEVTVEMPGIPYDECLETSTSLDTIKGLSISPGFTSKVKDLLRKNKKCLHLATLIHALTPAVMQGFWIYLARKPRDRGISSGMLENYLIGTCWVWRRDGPLAKRMKQKYNNK